jgi:hypothetical protein
MRTLAIGTAVALFAALALGGIAAAAAVKTDLRAEPAAPAGASGWVIVTPTPKGAVVELQLRGLAPDSKLFFHVADMGNPAGELKTDTKGNGHLNLKNVKIEGTSVDVAVHDEEHVSLMKATVTLPEEKP